ncbi:hypothetical protein D0469_00115 [Peribacillus saganii]|uniref:DUF5668 domain-containing protein n=1 Tax=Peribacillus saganii TaxID=2303992 RepID=A0A372LTN8_9BACI|nr:hypothetical protein [Peribacillus saganii]RFU71553.1 hypothetical protein D0469_00115 [Peribacillus saganii]
MKSQRYFPGIVLTGFGLYFFLEKTKPAVLPELFTWPTLLCIVGIAFLGQAYFAKDHESILPGTIFTGIGLHFHAAARFSEWPQHTGMFITIISLGFMLRARKTNTGMMYGILLFIISMIILFYDRLVNWLGVLETGVSAIWKFWPLLLIAIGFYLLFLKKK